MAHQSWARPIRGTCAHRVAWLLVHMLMHADLPYARQFRATISAPPSPNKGAALGQVVASVPAGDLDRDLHAYLQKSIGWRQHHAGPIQTPEDLERRELRESEVLIWWARLDRFRGKTESRAKTHLDAAWRNSMPGDGKAAFWLGRYGALHNDAARAEQMYRRAIELEPGNPDYMFGLLDLLWDDRQGPSWDAAARSSQVTDLVAQLAKSARS